MCPEWVTLLIRKIKEKKKKKEKRKKKKKGRRRKEKMPPPHILIVPVNSMFSTRKLRMKTIHIYQSASPLNVTDKFGYC